MNITETAIEQHHQTYTATVADAEVLLALFAMDRIRFDLELYAVGQDITFPDITATIDQLEACLSSVASLVISEEGICLKATHRQVETPEVSMNARFLAIGLEEILPNLDSATEQPLARQMIQKIQHAGVEY